MARWKVLHGDCRELIYKQKVKFDLIFADPPFGINHGYVGFKDVWESDAAYSKFTEEWVLACWRFALAPRGILCLHGPDKLADLYSDIARDYKFRKNRIAWVQWHYRFGVCSRHNWIDSRCHCMIFAKDPNNYTWTPDDVLVQSDRASTYADKRVGDHERGGSRLPLTVWGVPSDGPGWGRVQGNSKERRPGHPNQLPEAYLKRLILAYTSKNDYILDPFGGSGTTPVVAVSLGRNAMAIDVSEASCESIKRRIREGKKWQGFGSK